MIYIVKTGHIESDYFFIDELKSEEQGKKIVTVDYTDNISAKNFELELNSMSFFSTPKLYIIENVVLTKEYLKIFEQDNENSFIFKNPSIKDKAVLSDQKIIVKDIAITPTQLKRYIATELNKVFKTENKQIIDTIYEKSTYIDSGSKLIASINRAKSLLKHILLIAGSGNKNSPKLIVDYINSLQSTPNYWDMMEYFFSNDIKQKIDYFDRLKKSIDVYEIITNIKTAIALTIIIKIGILQHFDNASIAKHTGKNLFYVSKLAEMVKRANLSLDGIKNRYNNLMLLELSFRQGKIENLDFAFDTFLLY